MLLICMGATAVEIRLTLFYQEKPVKCITGKSKYSFYKALNQVRGTSQTDIELLISLRITIIMFVVVLLLKHTTAYNVHNVTNLFMCVNELYYISIHCSMFLLYVSMSLWSKRGFYNLYLFNKNNDLNKQLLYTLFFYNQRSAWVICR